MAEKDKIMFSNNIYNLIPKVKSQRVLFVHFSFIFHFLFLCIDKFVSILAFSGAGKEGRGHSYQ